MLLILTLCTCCYFGIDSMAELTKKAVGVLPFGKYIWDFYQVQTGTYENHIGSLSFTTLEFSKSLLKFVLTGYIYHFVVRKFVEFVLFDPIYDDEMVSKTYRISTKIKSEFFIMLDLLWLHFLPDRHWKLLEGCRFSRIMHIQIWLEFCNQ